MANSATLLGSIPVLTRSGNPEGLLKCFGLVLDTVADLDILTPAATKYVAVMGLLAAEATAANLTVKYGATPTTLVTLEFPANFNIIQRIDRPLLIVPVAGAKLILSPSAAISSAVIYLMEISRLDLLDL